MFKNLYEKTIILAGHKSSKSILGFVSFIESFIFPIPPDVLIIPMTIAKKNDWFRIGLTATVGSVMGALLGYFIGYIFFSEIGVKIFELYGVDNVSFLKIKFQARRCDSLDDTSCNSWLYPVLFKLLTITSGFVVLTYYTS